MRIREDRHMLRSHSIRMSTVLLVLATLVASPVRAGHPTPGEKCAVAKLKAAFKKMAKKAACNEKAVAANVPVDPACLAKAEQDFAAAFQKAEGKGGCATTADAAAIEGKVNACVADVVNALPPVPTTSTTSTTTTTTTTLPACGDSFPACNGTCPPPQNCGTSNGTCVCAFG
jgi:hypothetical protein